MSLLKSLFGIEPTVGNPKSDEPDWDESIHAGCDEPIETTGGRVISNREWLMTHDRGIGVPESKPSAWKAIDALPMVLPVIVLVAIIIIGLITVLASR